MSDSYLSRRHKKIKLFEPNVVSLVKQWEINEHVYRSIRRKLHATEYFIQKLGLEYELVGHTGCVNCIEWNSAGNLLASASDDTHVIIWDPFAKRLLHKFQTIHVGNIFSVKFLPGSSDSKVVTGAADFRSVVQDIVTKETISICSCALSRIKRIETCDDAPNLYWSASEDGMIRQVDIRVPHECDANSTNVLVNLVNHKGTGAEAKCVAINPLRPELLAVAANDPFVRLYDRRMIRSLTTQRLEGPWDESPSENEADWSIEDNLPSNCVQYYTPGHLGKRTLKRYRYVGTTYIAFSPNGRELLANYGNEQIYLFDIMRKHEAKYFTIPKYDLDEKDDGNNARVANGLNGVNTLEPFSIEEEMKPTTSGKWEENDPLPDYVQNLKYSANEFFKEKMYSEAIEAYNQAILLYSKSAVLYCNRAVSYMKRDWKGDVYAAIRDCLKALDINPDYMKAFFRLTRCHYELKRYNEAIECVLAFKKKFPKYAIATAFKALEKDIDTSYVKASSRASRRAANRMSHSEREWRNNAYDYEQRYCGHCNTTTDIKEANFFGSNGQYIVAGSDEGFIYIWNRSTETIVRILNGDNSIVNCLQPHKEICFLATSGIDPVIRLWAPKYKDDWINDSVVKDVRTAVTNNHRRLLNDPLEIIFRTSNNSNSSDDSADQPPILSCRPS